VQEGDTWQVFENVLGNEMIGARILERPAFAANVARDIRRLERFAIDVYVAGQLPVAAAKV
jgi:hypothetical protein